MICKFNTCGTCFNCYSKHFNKDCFPCEDADPMTNADRIRSMSDEELAEFIDRCEMNDIDYAKTFCDLCNGQHECDQCRLDWLKQPAE